jgi:hypothetical protein
MLEEIITGKNESDNEQNSDSRKLRDEEEEEEEKDDDAELKKNKDKEKYKRVMSKKTVRVDNPEEPKYVSTRRYDMNKEEEDEEENIDEAKLVNFKKFSK